MAKNIIRRVFSESGTFTVPAGVTKLLVRKIPITVYPQNSAGLGNATTFGIKADGSIYSCGINTNGQLGNNTVTPRSSPVAVVGGQSFIAMTSYSHNLALKNDGTLWTWGANANGQLGDNTVTPRSSPVAVVGGHSFIKIATGTVSLSMGLKSNGSVWSWGFASNGQLGDNTTTAKSSPVAVVGGHSFISISAGEIASALKADGSAWCWGTNTYGQLGNNSLTSRSSPVQVVGGHSFIAISSGGMAGYGFTAALKANGSVWCWGDDTNGQLGNNATNFYGFSSPVAVVGSHSFVAISASVGRHVLALKSNGSVWSWGVNGNGQLGDNTTNDRSSPVQVVGGHSFVAVFTGDSHSAALKEDGILWTWGANASGQLSSNTVTSRSSPVAILTGFIYSGVDKTSDFYMLTVQPDDVINYNTGFFGNVLINGPWLVEYEA